MNEHYHNTRADDYESRAAKLAASKPRLAAMLQAQANTHRKVARGEPLTGADLDAEEVQ